MLSFFQVCKMTPCDSCYKMIQHVDRQTNANQMRRKYLFMKPTVRLPIHGAFAYSTSLLKPFLTIHHTSWLSDVTKPHACGVVDCALMRAHLHALWARVGRGVALRHATRLALGRTLPSELALRITAMSTRSCVSPSCDVNAPNLRGNYA